MQTRTRILAGLLSLVMTFSVMGGFSGQVYATENTETIEANLSVEARYSSNHIRWTAVDGATAYNVLRSDTQDGTFTAIASNVTSTDYIDETAGTGTQKYYKVEAVKADGTVSTAAVCDTYPTGIEALQEHAKEQLHVDFEETEEGRTFNGTRVYEVDQETVNKIKDLEEGTVLVSFKPQSVTSRAALFLAKASATSITASSGPAADVFSIYQENASNVRMTIGSSFAFTYSNFVSTTGWTTVAMRNGSYTKSGDTHPAWKHMVSHNGVSAGFSNNYELFIGDTTGVDSVTIGGTKNSNGNAILFNGEIAYVTVTDEVLSETEFNAYTQAVSTALDNEPDVVLDTITAEVKAGYSKVQVSWNAVTNATGYRVFRSTSEGEEGTEVTSSAITNRSYTDTAVEKDTTYYYKVKAYNGTEEIAESDACADAAVGMAGLKAHAALAKDLEGDEQNFDGTKVIDVSDEYAEEVHEVNTGSVILRFKATDTNNRAILGTKASSVNMTAPDNINEDSTTFYLQSNGNFRFAYQHTRAGLNGPYSFTDGNWHCVVVSSSDTKAMRLTIDGQEVWSNTTASNKGMFAKQSVLDKVTIGGQVNPNNSVVYGFNGSISQVIVTSEELSDEEAIEISKAGYSGVIPSGSSISEMFNNTYADNSWVFVGGEAVQGGFDQTRGIRNYIGQFEEFVRWLNSGNEYGRQRYTINSGAAGRTLAEIVAHYDTYVTAFHPKAAAYMVGVEEYNQGTETATLTAFKENLKSFIDKSLALKENNRGFAVIQKPFASSDSDVNTKIQAYCEAVDAVVAEYEGTDAINRILVVDHYSQTNNDNFKTTMLKDATTLNAQGHVEIGKQFAAATYKSTTNFPQNNFSLTKTEVAQPEQYLDVQATVTVAESGSLHVVIPEGNGSSWKYILDMDGTTVEGTAASNDFTISGLADGKDYVLKLRSSDGTKQLTTLKGTLTSGAAAEKNSQTLDEKQQALADMMEEKDAMTWLFMGDSITHGALWTYGYDSIAQTFEKYLKDELGRTNDTVINTAVSGATTASTINTIDQRLKAYTPDVVSIMLGTNDLATTGLTTTVYKQNLKSIIDMIKEINEDAIIILRSPTPTWMGNRGTLAPSYIAAMEEVAEANDLIYIDQYTETQEVFNTYSWMMGLTNQFLYGDSLHPAANGHLIMTRQFIRACGLWTEDSEITNLFYNMPITEENSTVTPTITAAPGKIAVYSDILKEEADLNIGSITVKATSKSTAQSYAITAKAGEAYAMLENLPNGTYEVEVSTYLKNSAKHVTFRTVDVELTDHMAVEFDVLLDNTKAERLEAGAVVGNFSVSAIAPEGEYTYTLCDGEGSTDNGKFAISGSQLKTASELTEGETYSIRVKAQKDELEEEAVFSIYAVGSGLIFEKENVEITQGASVNLSGEEYAEKLFDMEEGTIIVQYTSDSDYIIQSLFSIGNGTTGNNNRHFHVYVKPDGTLGFELRNDSALNYGYTATNAVKADYKGSAAKNTIAFKADKETGEYKLFANGELVLTVNAKTIGGFKFIQDITGVESADIGATERSGALQYTFGGDIHYIQVYETTLTDEELIEITGETAFSEPQDAFVTADGTGSNYNRIPAIITTKNGTVISAADSRFGGTHDSPNNIDIMVARSTDDGSTWSEPEFVFHYDDFADDALTLPVGSGLRVNASASFIDPILLQDEETGRVFLISDAMFSGCGSPQAVSGSGYKEIDGKRYLKLKKAGETDYNYTVRENNVIWNDTTDTATEYSLNENFEILKDGVLQTVKQKTASYDPTSSSGAILTTTTNTDVAMNIMYSDAAFTALPTTWLYMKYSDDDGATWSDPILLNEMVKSEDSRILVVGPGRGTQIKNGEYSGRLIVPVYDNSKSGVIYSDDHGTTWTYAAGPDTRAAAMSETQIVELPDGSLRVYARSTNSKIASAVSVDGGATWTAAEYVDGLTQPGWGSQLSVISYSENIDGKPAIILSSPAGVGNYRRDGRVKIGLITDTGEEGAGKYDIEWKYDYKVDGTNVGFGYSCLTELTDGSIGLLYEKYDSYNSAELQTPNAIKYEVLTLYDLMGIEPPKPTPADKTALEAVIAEAEGLTAEDYTEESFAALTEALDAAKAVNGKEDATQAEVDAAKEALQAAIDALEESVTPDREVCEIFTDVKHDTWYEAAVQYVYDKGLMEGNGDKFTPNGQMTRGMFVTTLYRLAGEPEVTDRSACTELHDVAENAWYTDAVCWAYANEITTGYLNDMTFRTNVALSREQLATFLYRYAQYQELDTTATSDLEGLLNADKVKPYAEKEVKWAVGAGIISGMEIKDEAGNAVYDLAPQKTATRAQMAQILRNFCEAYDL